MVQVRVPSGSGKRGSNVIYFDVKAMADDKTAVREKGNFSSAMKRLPSVLHSRPWYREPWPWILMSGPFIVVIAALTTALIAVKTDDGLVTADYYKKGLSVNQTLMSSEQARKSGLTAGIRLADHGLFIRLQATDSAFSLPSLLLVSISHPTRAG